MTAPTDAHLPIVCTGNSRHPARSLRWSFVWYQAADGSERVKLRPEIDRDATRDVQELIRADLGGRNILQITCPRCGACKRVEWLQLFKIADSLRQLGTDQLDIGRLP